jgi:hypothetical protein
MGETMTSQTQKQLDRAENSEVRWAIAQMAERSGRLTAEEFEEELARREGSYQ